MACSSDGITDAGRFSQKVEGYEATLVRVNAKRSRGKFAGVKGQEATFLSLDAFVTISLIHGWLVAHTEIPQKYPGKFPGKYVLW